MGSCSLKAVDCLVYSLGLCVEIRNHITVLSVERVGGDVEFGSYGVEPGIRHQVRIPQHDLLPQGIHAS